MRERAPVSTNLNKLFACYACVALVAKLHRDDPSDSMMRFASHKEVPSPGCSTFLLRLGVFSSTPHTACGVSSFKSSFKFGIAKSRWRTIIIMTRITV